MQFEESDDLTDRQKAAMRLTAAFLERPSALSAADREEALKHFSPAEIVGLVLKLTSFLVNKPRPALGIDNPVDKDNLTMQDYSLARELRAQQS
jgi:hypothetical protein